MNKIIKIGLLPVLALAALIVLFINKESYSAIKVYPRLITPGAVSGNDNLFFDFDIFDEPKPELQIFDINGRLVRSAHIINPAATTTGWRFIWDAKDDGGNIVRPGVYIYEWREGNSITSGSVVVAR